MKASVTFTFAGLFAAVAVCYYFIGTPLSKPAAPLVVSGDGKLLPFDSEQPLRLIQIQNLLRKETITLENSGEGWYLRHPANYLADKMMAEGLVSALRVSTKSRRLMREKGWEEYGLARPDIKIGVEAKDSTRRRYLFLGDQSPVADSVYARWEGEEEYFLLDARLKQAFDRTVYSLREKRVVRLPVQSVEKIHMQTFKDNYELSRQEGKWYWTEPVSRIGKQVSDEKVYQLLLLLSELHIKEFLDGRSVEDKELGFLRAAPFMQLWTADKTSVLRIGKEIIDHDAYYGMLEEEKVAVEISKGLMDSLFQIFDRVQEKEAQAKKDEKPVSLAPLPLAAGTVEAEQLESVSSAESKDKGEEVSLLKT